MCQKVNAIRTSDTFSLIMILQLFEDVLVKIVLQYDCF